MMTGGKQQKTKLMAFKRFLGSRSLKEGIETEVSAASFIVLDGSGSAEDKHSAIDDFAEDLRNLVTGGQQVIAVAVAFN